MRRICNQPDISEEDIDDALTNLKASEGMNKESGLICLTAAHLCQQPLSELAADRLRKFKAFMEDTSQREAEKEESQLKQMRQVVSGKRDPN